MPRDDVLYLTKELEARPYLRYLSISSRKDFHGKNAYVIEIDAIGARNGDDRKVLVTEDYLIKDEDLIKILVLKEFENDTALVGVMDHLMGGHSLKHVNRRDLVWK